MPISFTCACGKALAFPDEHAGKRKRCPACRADLTVPAADGADDFEVLDDGPAPKPAPKPAAAAPPPPAEPPPKPKKKKRKPEKESGLAAMYMQEARMTQERDDARYSRRGEDDGNRTLFGVTISAGVIAGASMSVAGALGVVFLLIFRDYSNPRLFVGAIVCLGLGLVGLVKALWFGEED